MNETLSDRIYIIKAIAIVSVVCAHVAGNVNTRMGYIMSNILENVGSIGVALFLCISGYFFAKTLSQTSSLLEYIKNRLIRLGIPWLLSAMVIYFQLLCLYHPKNWKYWSDYILPERLNGDSCIKFVLGYNSYYYYMSILLCCYFMFLILRRSSKCVLIVMYISLIHILFFYTKAIFTPNLNPLNWFLYFGFGICLVQYRHQMKLLCEWNRGIEENKIFLWTGGMATAGVLIYISYRNIIISYGHPLYLLYILVMSIYLYMFSGFLQKKKYIGRRFVYIGKQSFFIYLYHMGLQGIGVQCSIVIIRPIIVIGIMVMINWVVKKIVANRKYMQSSASLLLGINMK